MSESPERQGLYDPRREHDSRGVDKYLMGGTALA